MMITKKISIFSLLFLLLIGCGSEDLTVSSGQEFGAVSEQAIATPSHSKVVNIATYNLHLFLNVAPFEDQLREESIIDFVRRDLKKNDILFLTEVWTNDSKNEIISSLKGIYPYSMRSDALRFGQGDGLLILSKFPILENVFTVFNDKSGADWFVPKGFHKTRFSTPQGDFYSFFTHVQADENQSRTRRKQFEQMQGSVQKVKEVPSIILGDLNVIGDRSWEYGSLKDTFRDYRDAYREDRKNKKEYGYTYNNTTNDIANYFYPVKNHGKSQERLDYILVSKDWKVLSSDMMDRCNYDSPYMKKKVSCSDHYGLEARLLLTTKVTKKSPYIANTSLEAHNIVQDANKKYGFGASAKIIIHNKTDKDLVFKSKTSWWNSTFYTAPVDRIPAGKYAVTLAVHDTGAATGVFNQLTYKYGTHEVSFGTYVPWSWLRTNNIFVDFGEINQDTLDNHSTRPTIFKKWRNLKITGKIDKGDNPYVLFTIEKQ